VRRCIATVKEGYIEGSSWGRAKDTFQFYGALKMYCFVGHFRLHLKNQANRECCLFTRKGLRGEKLLKGRW
jgi:hypothetical protein